MRKLYEKQEVLFAVLWILAYCLVMTPIRGRFSFESPWMLAALADQICIGATILGAAAYCLYLGRLQKSEEAV